MTWVPILTMRFLSVGMNDCIVSWDPETWRLRIWFIKHVVVDTLGGKVPEMISMYPPEAYYKLWPQYGVGGINAKFSVVPVHISLTGYPGIEAVPPSGLYNGVNFSEFGWAVVKFTSPPAEPNFGYVPANPNKSSLLIEFAYSNISDPSKQKIPSRSRWGASFTTPPIELLFRLNKDMPTKFKQLQIGTAGQTVSSFDSAGVPYDVKDVSAEYLAASKGSGNGTIAFPRRVNLLDSLGGFNPVSIAAGLPPNFFNPTPKTVWYAARVGNQLSYLPGSKIIGANQAKGNFWALAKYEQSMCVLPLFGLV